MTFNITVCLANVIFCHSKRSLLNPLIKDAVFYGGNKCNSTPSQNKMSHIFLFFNIACLNRMVFQPLVELQRTLKGQFNFQSI